MFPKRSKQFVQESVALSGCRPCWARLYSQAMRNLGGRQLQRQLLPPKQAYRGLMHVTQGAAAREGLQGLWVGHMSSAPGRRHVLHNC